MTSEFVIAEFLRAPATKSSNARRFFENLRVLETPTRLAEVVQAYVSERLMPADAMGDAAHLAMASLHAADFVLTWNCRHLANANKTRHIGVVNARLGLPTPIIATPFEIVPE